MTSNLQSPRTTGNEAVTKRLQQRSLRPIFFFESKIPVRDNGEFEGGFDCSPVRS